MCAVVADELRDEESLVFEIRSSFVERILHESLQE